MIVVDASAWARALMDSGPSGGAARCVLSGDPDWMVPAHAPFEVLRTIRRYESAKLISAAQATDFANEVASVELRYGMPEEWLLAKLWSWRRNISAYDAPYVALAQRYEAALVTFDLRLARAAEVIGVQVLIPEQG